MEGGSLKYIWSTRGVVGVGGSKNYLLNKAREWGGGGRHVHTNLVRNDAYIMKNSKYHWTRAKYTS